MKSPTKVMTYNFSVYIHTNRMNHVPAQVAKYSYCKHNPELEVYLDYLEDHPPLLKYDKSTFYRHYGGKKKLCWLANKYQAFFPVRFLCSETHKKKKRKHKWILVVDPDIFCLKSLSVLNDFIKEAEKKKINVIAIQRNSKVKLSSAMLLNTEKILWNEADLLEDMFEKKNDFDKWMFLQEFNCLNLPDEFNLSDELYEDTVMLHVSKPQTQPWKTGIAYKECELDNLMPGKDSKTLIFEKHPNDEIYKMVIKLFEEAYENKYFSDAEVGEAINIKALRPDILKK